ncbi:polysaccharide pyruvyl transferase WcaK-like protein [Pedobacter africanus]|uniref:Polysaccharide pyruvyl transferase WcaK-like protein n=1 Tax=Pedobacter africanus TaxID=151894 RepID=A0ACC6KT25_9SPHI|nr:polysaccharide pyruvyl transferase family protein [Pedobacter africanus]MDR6782295.1 polysaccharide pyruvyl transferase WcaK-like protein [Pedobacter africanus]
MTHISRKDFLKHTLLFAGYLAAVPALAQAGKTKKSLLLRSSWQVENIGDIGHTPGVLALIEKYLPHVQVRLWPDSVKSGVEEMLLARFPSLKIIKSAEDKQQALRECDFFLHGSGPSLVGRKELKLWKEERNAPYGIYGITFPGNYGFQAQDENYNPLDVELFNAAAFTWFRDSVSLRFAKKIGIKCPLMGFCPDGAFAVDVRNDQAADAFLKSHALETGKFVCVIPQLRFSPWWEIPSKQLPVNEEKRAWNEKMKEHDNRPIRDAIIEVVRQTDLKVLIVPENETQIRIGKEMLYDPLPEDVKSRIIWRDKYWLTDEAVSTYARSAGLFGLEMHSPIMCIALGVPAIVCRFTEQTSKGFMWDDIGLGEWLFDMDTPADVNRIVPAVLDMLKNPEASKAKVNTALKLVRKYQKDTMKILGQCMDNQLKK